MTLLSLHPNEVAFAPSTAEFLLDEFGVPSKADPDVQASLHYPDMRPFPNPERTPDPFVSDPWKKFNASSVVHLSDEKFRHVVMSAPSTLVDLRHALCGLNPWEFMHPGLFRFADLATIDLNKRISVLYPVLTPSLGILHADEKFSHLELLNADKPGGLGMAKLLQMKWWSALRACVRLYIGRLDFPPPPACPFKGCFEFARYKAIAWDVGVEMKFACQAHLPLIQYNESASFYASKEYRIVRTLKTWALNQVRTKGKGPTRQLTLGGF